MRRGILASIVLLSMGWMVACTTKEAEPVIEIGENDFTLPYLGDTVVVRISSNAAWTWQVNRDWVTVSSHGDDYMEIAVGENDGPEGREAIMMIYCGAEYRNVHISQDAAPMLSAGTRQLQLPASGGHISIPVSSNVSYDVAVDVGWIVESGTKSLGTDVLEFTVEPNEGMSARTGHVLLRGDGVAETVEIRQEQNDCIAVTEGDIVVGAEGGDFDVPVSANVDFSVETGVPWLDFIGDDGGILHFFAQPNGGMVERIGWILLRNGSGVSAKATVVQKPTSGVSPMSESISVGSSGGVVSMGLMANVEFECEVVSGDDWLEVAGVSDMGDMQWSCALRYSDNRTSQVRIGEVKISSPDLDGARVVFVLQDRPSSSLSFVYEGYVLPSPNLQGCFFPVIDWGDGTMEPCLAASVHEYSDPGPHNVSVTTEGIERFSLSSLSGIRSMDLSILY